MSYFKGKAVAFLSVSVKLSKQPNLILHLCSPILFTFIYLFPFLFSSFPFSFSFFYFGRDALDIGSKRQHLCFAYVFVFIIYVFFTKPTRTQTFSHPRHRRKKNLPPDTQRSNEYELLICAHFRRGYYKKDNPGNERGGKMKEGD